MQVRLSRTNWRRLSDFISGLRLAASQLAAARAERFARARFRGHFSFMPRTLDGIRHPASTLLSEVVRGGVEPPTFRFSEGLSPLEPFGTANCASPILPA